MDDKEVIQAFVDHLNANGHPNLKIDCWPDENNRQSQDIDAIAGSFAIEHTSIDTIENQRRDSDYFMQVIEGLEAEFVSKLNFRLEITISYDAVQTGQDWNTVRDAMRSWIGACSRLLKDGEHTVNGVKDIPFKMRVWKASARPPGLIFSRLAPDDPSLPDRIRKLLEEKAKKLAPYKKKGKTTVLLLESDDGALMSKPMLLKAIKKGHANKLPDGVDRLWYADTSISNDLEFHDFTKEVLPHTKGD